MSSIKNKAPHDVWGLIEQKLSEDKHLYADLNAVYEFQLTDVDNGTYQLAFHNGEFSIHVSHVKEAGCILKMKENNFTKFLLGELNSTTAFMTGKLKIDGSIGLALKLESLLKQFDFTV